MTPPDLDLCRRFLALRPPPGELLLCAPPRRTDDTELSVLLRVRSQGGWLGDWSARRRARAATTRALSPG